MTHWPDDDVTDATPAMPMVVPALLIGAALVGWMLGEIDAIRSVAWSQGLR